MICSDLLILSRWTSLIWNLILNLTWKDTDTEMEEEKEEEAFPKPHSEELIMDRTILP